MCLQYPTHFYRFHSALQNGGVDNKGFEADYKVEAEAGKDDKKESKKKKKKRGESVDGGANGHAKPVGDGDDDDEEGTLDPF